MPDAILIAQKRTETGSGVARRLRRDGQVPAVVYGLGGDTNSVSVAARDLDQILHSASGGNTLITLRSDGGDQLTLARQVHRHPVRGIVLHVDFVRVRADQTIQAEVPVRLVGEAEGSRSGGLLEQSLFTLTIEAKPGDIPDAFEVDISELAIGDALHVSDVAVPGGVIVLQDLETVVAHVSAPRGVEEEEGAEAAEGEAGEDAGEGAAAEATEGGGED